jgi:chromatin remodeling complex protein RSC6
MAPKKNTNSQTPAEAAVAATNASAAAPAVDANNSSGTPATSPTTAGGAPANAVAERVNGAIERVNNAIEVIKGLNVLLKEQLGALKVLQRDVATLQKENGKRRGGKSSASNGGGNASGTEGGAPRKPSGFAKPAQLTGELCEFLGVPANTLMARTDVTRLITKYVKDNKLHNEADKRTIQPDGKLLKLLAIKEEDKLTYFNLQSHIKHHFIKDVPAVATAPAVVVAA